MTRSLNRRSFLKLSAAGTGAAAWSLLSRKQIARAAAAQSIVGIGACPYGASAAEQRAAFRFAVEQALPPAIGGSQSVTVKPAVNSNGAFPKTASPFATAEAALWAAEQTSSVVTVGDHSGTYPVSTLLERGGFNRDSLDAMDSAGIAAAVAARMAEAGNIEILPFDSRRGTGEHLIHPDYDYPFEFETVLAPGAQLWRQDLSADDIAEFETATGQIVGPSDGLMNITNAVSPDRYFVNVARVSHHVIGGITYAAKNLVGILDRPSRVRMHFVLPARDAFAGLTRPFELPQLGIIAEIALARRPELNVVDASKIQLNFGPDDGTAGDLGFHLFVASTDIAATDAVCLGIHQHAYQRFRARHWGIGLPFTYGHLEPDYAVWDHAMIRHSGAVTGGAGTGSDVQLVSDSGFHDIDGYSELFDYLVDHVLGSAPGGKFDAPAGGSVEEVAGC